MKRAIFGLAGLVAVVLVLAFPGFASADVSGGCTAQGHSTGGGTIDLTTAKEWHMKSTDTAGGSGTAPAAMKSASVVAHALGLSIPIASASAVSGTSGEVDNVDMSTFALLGQRFSISGSATGDGGTCSGQITVIFDDVNPLMTVFGGGGAAVAGLGIVVVLLGVFLGGGLLSRLLAGLFGGLGGVGLALSLEQFGILDPTSTIGLLIALLGLVAGLFLAGSLHRQPAVPTQTGGWYVPPSA
jgi:hypothetical protein